MNQRRIFEKIPQEEYHKHIQKFSTVIASLADGSASLKTVQKLLASTLYSARSGPSINYPLYRISTEFQGFDKFKSSCFGHPPKEDTKIGRANKAGYPVLYLASDKSAAIHETIHSYEEPFLPLKLFVSTWQPIMRYNCFQFAYPSIDLEHKLSSFSNTSTEVNMKNEFAHLHDKGEHFINLIKSIGSVFLRPDYSITSEIAHHYLYEFGSLIAEEAQVHAIMYPSIQMNLNSFNYAFHPTRAKDVLYIKMVEEITLTSVKRPVLSCDINSVGLPKCDGTMVWHKLNWANSLCSIISAHVRTSKGIKDLDIRYTLPVPDYQSRLETYIDKNKLVILDTIRKQQKNWPSWYPGSSLNGTVFVNPDELGIEIEDAIEQRIFLQLKIQPDYDLQEQ